jgi:hypothetical protein
MRQPLVLIPLVVVALGASACSSGPGISFRPVAATVHQDPTGRIHETSVTCGLEQLGTTGGIGAVTASGTAVNVGQVPVEVRIQAGITNPKGEKLLTAATDSDGALPPGHSWHWMATQGDVALPKGVSDSRVAGCVVATVSGTPS